MNRITHRNQIFWFIHKRMEGRKLGGSLLLISKMSDINYGRLVCDICRAALSVRDVADHNCFLGAEEEDILLDGNVVKWAQFDCLTDDDGIECLDDDDINIPSGNKENKEKQYPAPNKKKITQRKTNPSHSKNFEQINENEMEVEFERNGAKKRKTDPSHSKNLQQVNEKEMEVEFERNGAKKRNNNPSHSKNLEQINENEMEVEFDRNGTPKVTIHNMIVLIDMVRKRECIWNYTLPMRERGNYKIATSWMEISQALTMSGKEEFGWNVAIVKQRYCNLRGTYFRRRMLAPSGSPTSLRQSWPYEPYFSFLGDIVEPTKTTTNVPPLKENANVENLGFVQKPKATGLKRKPKKTEDIQGSILEALANRRKGASKLQNWGPGLQKKWKKFQMMKREQKFKKI